MDLARCVDALERPENALYEWNFVRNLKRRMRRKARRLPQRFDLAALRSVRTVRQFDDAYTAPHHGFRDADDYYHRASSLRVIDQIAVPTLILSASDDPFVPPEQFRDPAIAGNPHIHRRGYPGTADTAASLPRRRPASTAIGPSVNGGGVRAAPPDRLTAGPGFRRGDARGGVPRTRDRRLSPRA